MPADLPDVFWNVETKGQPDRPLESANGCRSSCIAYGLASFRKDDRMRKVPEPTEREINEGPQAVSFQIADGNTRRNCTLQTKLPTKLQAQKYLMANWPVIEKMARDAAAAGNLEDGQIKLVMI